MQIPGPQTEIKIHLVNNRVQASGFLIRSRSGSRASSTHILEILHIAIMKKCDHYFMIITVQTQWRKIMGWERARRRKGTTGLHS